ncbi:ribosomal RNA large subunit methyltransferase F [Prolixibacter bellariivorans]|uniref:Ribosomal RNA large subunit methyltransferase F n=1 Tax=Prolixibacter bellariivorans TaxID=314319 RepID=A0A5M4B2J8_9BACT|nr:23S rRNA (adenine(1618)-N(6))-methyltransferase RlmF [Prolixibacter bellariivorans]GET34342.1 ribosomal RNA large subunit methyltransferase F [Prolixibacter bellariivorans]
MSSKENRKKEPRLHSRNRNRERYDIRALVTSNPELANHIKPNKLGEDSIDFSNPVAVKILNQSLLNHYYGIKNWDFPDENLCPPIPGRADYLHHMADLLGENNFGTIPKGRKITCLDIGVGANCIYPIIGVTEYDWNFIGSDIEPKSLESATNIVRANPTLNGKIECKLQVNPAAIFHGIVGKEDKIDLSICNPPFHSSSEDAQKGTRRKIKNLSGKKVKDPTLNFAGISNELICDGGEYQFIHTMIRESKEFGKNCYWFSTLVSKQSNLKGIYKALEKFEASQIKTIPMGTGNKSTRIVAWTFLSKGERRDWAQTRWRKQDLEQ